MAIHPCHQGVVYEGCLVVGTPHPSHPFTEPHPMVYEIARATWNLFLLTNEILKGSTVHPIAWEHLCGILKVLIVSPAGIISSASPFNEGLGLNFFIQDSRVDGGGDFIQREVFQALPEGKRSQTLEQHRSLQIWQIVIDGRDLSSPPTTRGRLLRTHVARPPIQWKLIFF